MFNSQLTIEELIRRLRRELSRTITPIAQIDEKNGMVQVCLDHLYKLGASTMAEICKAKIKRQDAETQENKRFFCVFAPLRLCVKLFML